MVKTLLILLLYTLTPVKSDSQARASHQREKRLNLNRIECIPFSFLVEKIVL